MHLFFVKMILMKRCFTHRVLHLNMIGRGRGLDFHSVFAPMVVVSGGAPLVLE